jgi:hypothetical protein
MHLAGRPAVKRWASRRTAGERRAGAARLAMVATAYAVVFVLAGCTFSDEPALTRAQANERGDQLIREAAAQLKPAPELVRRPNQDVVCQGLDRSSPDRITIGRVYQLRGLSAERAPDYVNTLRDYWTGQGFKPIDAPATYPLLRVEHPKDHFKLSFSVRNGVAELMAVRTCVRS